MDIDEVFPVQRVARVAFIRTSDRITFRRCRRKFNWSYIHRENLTGRKAKAPLWFGTGFHFAMEDYHGLRMFETPTDAFRAYVSACRRTPGFEMPSDWEEHLELGIGMFDYYAEWLGYRDPLVTLEVGGVPQVEVNFQVPINLDPQFLNSLGYDRAVYTGTIDRVVLDDEGRIWLVDYKTAKAIQTSHLETDPQITAYCWAAQQIYNLPVAGFLYQQHRKVVAHEPAFLKSTKMFSVAKNQLTTHTLYRNALLKLYGDVTKAPDANIAFLNELAAQESQRADSLIARNEVERNQHQIDAEGPKIVLEAYDMLNPDLALYPNPTRDCSWDCDFRTACLNMDDGSDWVHEIEQSTINREEDDLSWRSRVQYPELPEPLPRLHLARLRRRQPPR